MGTLADFLRNLQESDNPLGDAPGEALGRTRNLKRDELTSVLRETPEMAAAIASGAASQAAGGWQGLYTLAKTGGNLDAAVKAIADTQEKGTYVPRSTGARQGLGYVGEAIEPINKLAKENIADPVGAVSPMLGAALTALPEALPGPKGFSGAKAAGRAAKAVTGAERGVVAAEGAAPVLEAVPRSRAALTAHFPDDPDIVDSLLTNEKYKATKMVPGEDIEAAANERGYLRAEEPVLPKPAAQMSEADWKAWGEQHGVNMTVTPDQSLGVSDIATRRELKLPGGMEGKFSVPDLFQIKSNNFDPTILGRDLHNDLMKKFLRTYDRPGGMPPEEKFNALNFALLSPNAPLGPNEFLAARFRVRNPEELSALADTPKELLAGEERGTGSASRGGMGAKGTANLGNMQRLAQVLRDKPEMFEAGAGETLHDVARRTMNQVPGLGSKTASLGVPWFDLPKANTSAIDLHMIREGFPRLLRDPELGADFTGAVGRRMGIPDATPDLLEAHAHADPAFAKSLEETAIDIIGGNTRSMVYRTAKGEVNPDLHPSITPDKLLHEPKQAKEFGPFYNKMVEYVNESRGENPEIALFPEQWRKWDTLRGRIEPHEIMHPDYKKLPRMSWEELLAAKQANAEAGYFAKGAQQNPGEVPWGRLFYGKADPKLLAGTAAATGGGLALARERAKALRDDDEEKR